MSRFIHSWSVAYFKLLKDGLIDLIYSLPLYIIVLVHELDAACNTSDKLLLFFCRGCEQLLEHLPS